MGNWFSALSHPLQALIAALFTYAVTAAGASLVFFFRKTNKNLMDAMLGFAAGVMVAASFWSLLNPGIEMAGKLHLVSWMVALIGFLSGGILLFAGDRLFDSMERHSQTFCSSCSGSFKRCLLLIFSITLHNIPEGLCIGVSFGSLSYHLEDATLPAACLLALGIGLQNFPEGTAVSLPLKREGFSGKKAFFYGQLSGIVEPIAAVIGALLVGRIRFLLPFLLCFAAGAMVYVVVEELIPESQSNQKKDLMALFTLLGFAVMMTLDLALG